MIAFDTNPNLRWLFCMTHPDDEISICAWIRRLRHSGNEVFMSWTHDTPRRREEAYVAAKLLDIPRENLFFHGAVDRHAVDDMPRLTESFQAMMSLVKPDRVACGAFEQGHIDHDTTNFLVHRTYEGVVLEIPFYYTYLTRSPIINRFWNKEGQEVIQLLPEEQRFKISMAKAYPSQAIYRNLMLAEARQRLTRLKPDRLRATERMRVQTHFDFLSPNVPPRLRRYLLRSRKWRHWDQVVRAILYPDVQATDAASRPAVGPGSDRRATL